MLSRLEFVYDVKLQYIGEGFSQRTLFKSKYLKFEPCVDIIDRDVHVELIYSMLISKLGFVKVITDYRMSKLRIFMSSMF